VRRVLFDENVPRKLRRDIPEFSVRTAQEEGWDGTKNGKLLRLASETFEVLLTADQGLRFQQNVAQFRIGVVVIETVDTTLPNLRRMLSDIRSAVERVLPGEVIIVKPR
jgi:predicted nuclease of predicted toxin-antitoxin system